MYTIMLYVFHGNSPEVMLKVEENIVTNIHGSCFYTIDATPHNTLSPFGCIEIHNNNKITLC